jgi:hypothetical protein
MIAETENTTALTGNRDLVTEQATQNDSNPALVRRPEIPVPLHCLPVTDAAVLELYEYVFAPWVKMLGLSEFKVCAGTRRLFKFALGHLGCGTRRVPDQPYRLIISHWPATLVTGVKP